MNTLKLFLLLCLGFTLAHGYNNIQEQTDITLNFPKATPEPRAVFNDFKSKLKNIVIKDFIGSLSFKNSFERNKNNPVYDFFKDEILHWAEKYNKLGILDEVVDAYFKITKTNPNTIVIFYDNETSFFKFVTHYAAYGYKPAQILFEKLHSRGGDLHLIINGATTLSDVEDICKKNCNPEITHGPEATRVCKSSQEMLERLKEKVQQKN